MYALLATSGRDQQLAKTLASLAKCDLPPNFKGLILVENGVQTDVRTVIKDPEFERLHIQYLYTPVASKSNALNLGLKAIADDEALLFFSDNDIVFRNNILVSYSLAGEASGPGHYFGGSVERAPESVIPEIWKTPFLPLSVLGWNPDKTVASTFFLGCNWAAFKSDLVSLGGFDMRFGPGSVFGASGQETDMQTRLIISGCKAVYVKDAVAAHNVLPESTSLRWMLKRQVKGGVYAGLTPVESTVNFQRSYAFDSQLRVLDCAPVLTGSDLLRHFALKIAMKCAWLLGLGKGVLLRRRDMRR